MAMSKESILEVLQVCIFDGELYDTNCFKKIMKPLKNKIGKENFDYYYGATKLVLIFKDCDFVIKIPFTGEYEGYPFREAGLLEFSEWDYCKVEALRFKDAEEEHLDTCFAKTELIGTINSYPIYSQPKVDRFAKNSDYLERKKTSTREKCLELKVECFHAGWLSDILDYYGEETFKKLMAFIEKVECNDLHGGNLGYIGDRPVLVDYSGYYG